LWRAASQVILGAMAVDREAIVARARVVYDAYDRRDWDAFFANADPEPEWDPVEENVVYRGREEILAYFGRWVEAWVEFHAEPEQIEVSPDGDRTLAEFATAARSWAATL
jgi:SnoaL-like domain